MQPVSLYSFVRSVRCVSHRFSLGPELQSMLNAVIFTTSLDPPYSQPQTYLCRSPHKQRGRELGYTDI